MCTLCDDRLCPTRRDATTRSKQSRILGTWNDEDHDRDAPTLSDLVVDAKPTYVEPRELDDAAWYVGSDPLESGPESPIRWRITGPLEFPEYCLGERPGVVVGPIASGWELAAFAERLMIGHEHGDGGTIAECLLGVVPARRFCCRRPNPASSACLPPQCVSAGRSFPSQIYELIGPVCVTKPSVFC